MAKKKKKKKKQSEPPMPRPIDVGQVMQQAAAASAQSTRDQLAATAEFYPRMEQLQLGTVSAIRDQLNNSAYTQGALRQINEAMAQRADMQAQGARMGTMGGQISEMAMRNLAGGPTAAEQNIQALGQSAMGVRANQVVAPGQGAVRNVSAPTAQAARMGNVADVRAQQVAASRMGDFGRATSRDIAAGQVGAGALGDTLMGRAQQMARSTGRLSAEAERDAVQSARQGMAARGLATGGAGMAAEMLNRDRYSRQRQFEDLGFAQGVQGQDLTRQFQNVGNRLAADQSNQAAAMQAEMANLQARYNAAAQNGNWEQAAAIQNQATNLQASLANQQTQFNTGQFNASNQQQANMVNADAQMRASLANQSRDQFLTAAGMDAQVANQAANMNQTAANRAFMLDANQAFNQGTIQRRDQAANQAALGGNLMQGAAAQFGNAANLGLAGASATSALDPYARALGNGLQSGGQTQANLMQGIGQTYANTLDAGLGVASFNTNMQASMYNSYLNNQAAMQAARMGAGASRQAGMMGMIGGIGGGALAGAGAIGMGLAI